MKIHGDEFVKELLLRSKENDEKIASQIFLRLFIEKATGSKDSKFKGSIGIYDDSIMLYGKYLTQTECIQIEEFLEKHLQSDDYHAEGGAVYPAAGYPKQYVPVHGEMICWVVNTDVAINILLPAVGFDAPVVSPPKLASPTKNSSFTAFFLPNAEDSNSDSDPDDRNDSYLQCKIM